MAECGPKKRQASSVHGGQLPCAGGEEGGPPRCPTTHLGMLHVLERLLQERELPVRVGLAEVVPPHVGQTGQTHAHLHLPHHTAVDGQCPTRVFAHVDHGGPHPLPGRGLIPGLVGQQPVQHGGHDAQAALEQHAVGGRDHEGPRQVQVLALLLLLLLLLISRCRG